MSVNKIIFLSFTVFILNAFNNQSFSSNTPFEQTDINKMVNTLNEEMESQKKSLKKTQKKINQLPGVSEDHHTSTGAGSSTTTSSGKPSGSSSSSRPKS